MITGAPLQHAHLLFMWRSIYVEKFYLNSNPFVSYFSQHLQATAATSVTALKVMGEGF